MNRPIPTLTAWATVIFLVPSWKPCAPDELERLAADYQIEIVTTAAKFPVDSTYGRIDGQAAGSAAIRRYSPLFAGEFRRYPPELVRRARLRRVVLCEELAFASQRRNSIPDYEHDTLYLDVSRGNHSTPYLRKVIHHEFFHIIDYRDDGSVYRDLQWENLNPPEFRYRGGGRNAQDSATTSVLTDRFPGFLNHYSTTGVEEDKAEVFANLLVDRAAVDRRTAEDPVLRQKVHRMQQLLHRFCPAINDGFWQLPPAPAGNGPG